MGRKESPFLKCLILLSAFSSFAFLPYLRPGFTGAHDAELSIYRLIEFDKVLSDGIWFPRWAPDFFFGYGFPFFNYYAPLPYYLAEIPHRLGMSIPNSVEAVFLLGLVCSGLSMYLLARDILREWPALVASVAYVYFPYHLVDAHFRGDVGELFAFVWFPIILWSARRAVSEGSWLHVALGAIVYALLILTHNIMALIFSGLFFAYVFWEVAAVILRHRNLLSMLTKTMAKLLVFVFLAFGLSAFFWVPAIMEKDQVQISRAFENKQSAYSFSNNFSDNLFSTSLIQEYAFVESGIKRYRIEVGTVQLLGLVLAIPALGFQWLLRKRHELRSVQSVGPNDVLFFTFFSCLLLFLMLPISLPLWERIPMMVFVQTPWRFLSLLGICTSILVGHLLGVVAGSGKLDRFICPIAVALIIVSSTFGLNPSQTYWLDSQTGLRDLFAFESLTQSIGTTAADEYLPNNVLARPQTSPLVGEYMDSGTLTKVKLARGSGNLEVIESRSNTYTVNYQGETPGEVLFLIPAFPGWTAYVDGKESGYTVTEPLGEISVPVEAGQHTVSIVFKNTPIRDLAETVSLIALTLLIVLGLRIVWSYQKRRREFSERITGQFRPHVTWRDTTVLSVIAVVLLASQRLPGLVQTPVPSALASPLDVRFSDSVQLEGFRIETRQVCPGDSVQVHLFWKLTGQPDANLSSFVHLVDPEKETISQQDKAGFLTQFQNASVENGQLAEDVYQLAVPPTAIPGFYRVRIGMYDRNSLKRLSIQEENLTVAPFDEDATFVTLAPIEVCDHAETENSIQYPSTVAIGPGIKFLGFASPLLSPEHVTNFTKNNDINLTLYWEANTEMSKDYTLFVHMLGGSEVPGTSSRVWGQKDEQPFGGFYPTSLWRKGEVVKMPLQVKIRDDALPGVYEVELGVYESWSGERANIYDSGNRPIGDRIVLGQLRLVP